MIENPVSEHSVTGHEDPEGETPWAMQIVVRVEKTNPPTHTAVLEAVARACVLALHSFEAGDEKVRARVARWRSGRIRKVVRRARGSAWERSDVPGAVTVELGGVQVRVCVPGPVDQVPAEVAKLQVGGLSLAEAGPIVGDAGVGLYLNPELGLSTGKAAAQVAHAAQLVYESLDATRRSAWLETQAQLAVRAPSVEEWATHRAAADVVVTDAGFTEIPAGSRTCVAVHNL